MRFQNLVDRMCSWQSPHGGNDERFHHEMALEPVRDGELVVEVGAPHPQFDEQPVLGTISASPDRIVRSRGLVQLDGQRDQVVVGSHVEQHHRSRQVAVIRIPVDGLDSGKNRIIRNVHVPALKDYETWSRFKHGNNI